MKSLGASVPNDMTENGIQYLVTHEGLYTDANSQADRFWTLAMAKHPDALKAKNTIDTTKLTLHGWVAYLYGLELTKLLTPQLIQSFENRYLSKQVIPEENYWYYWNR